MELWESYAHGNTKEVGKGMDHMPTMRDCDKIGIVGDHFRQYGRYQDINDLESMLELAGITDYAKFISAYHIHGQAATGYDEKLCALDWYFQDAHQRKTDAQYWDHYLLLDQVCPTQYHKASMVRKMPNMYQGWEDHKLGYGN